MFVHLLLNGTLPHASSYTTYSIDYHCSAVQPTSVARLPYPGSHKSRLSMLISCIDNGKVHLVLYLDNLWVPIGRWNENYSGNWLAGCWTTTNHLASTILFQHQAASPYYIVLSQILPPLFGMRRSRVVCVCACALPPLPVIGLQVFFWGGSASLFRTISI